MSLDSFNIKDTLFIRDKRFTFFNLKTLEAKYFKELDQLPYSLKILLENLLRHEDGETVKNEDIHAIIDWLKTKQSTREIAFRPARVLMQDFTGVPAIVDLSAMRDAISALGGHPEQINPLSPVDLVIDHSVQIDAFGSSEALATNNTLEMQRNLERYAFLRWGQTAFSNFSVVPPDTGICHQVNLEYLAKTVWQSSNQDTCFAYPDTVVGTDSHTTMINGLGVLGWGVGGIEAEAAMLGQPISMLIPEVVGVKLTGKLQEGITATDLVLTITEILRKKGVVGKFVEFTGEGIKHLPVADRATLANMAPEYGATCGFFPIDAETLNYLALTGRDEETIALTEAYAKAQGLWRNPHTTPLFTDLVELDLSTVQPSMAGPKRPQDRVLLNQLPGAFNQCLIDAKREQEKDQSFAGIDGLSLQHGAVVIAAITSCTNTSNPSVLMAAGLLAKKACEKGLKQKPWVKTSLAPGSQVVESYLAKSGLQTYLNQLGFYLAGFGCTTCIGNSGPLPAAIAQTVTDNDLIVSAVLSGNRNFEGRIHPQVKANWLASPPLVVALAIAGTTRIDLTTEPLGQDQQGNPVYLKEIWPSPHEIATAMTTITHELYNEKYANVFTGSEKWQNISIPQGNTYIWQDDSTYIQHPPYFTGMPKMPRDIQNIAQAKILAIFGDSITTDHISPAGSIKIESPAGQYLIKHGVEPKDFNSYGARRGNHEVMVRGTFANIRIKNEMMHGKEGGYTQYYGVDAAAEAMTIYDAAMKYQEHNTPLIIVAGKEYGTGSSRDWAAKGPALLGVKAVIAESFERIHRSNLIGMGILPLQFKAGESRQTLGLTGNEVIDISGLNNQLQPKSDITATITYADGKQKTILLQNRIDTKNEVDYYHHGGILQYVLRKIAGVH